nr:MAG TPA: Mature oligodendrocyte transmembrane protein [Microviridae sp.]
MLLYIVTSVLFVAIVFGVSCAWCSALSNCYTKSADPPKQTE